MSAGILSSTDFPNSAARMLSIGNHSVCLHSTVREYAVLLCYTTNGLLTIHLDLYNHKKVVLSIIIDTRRAHNDVIIVCQQQRPAQKCSYAHKRVTPIVIGCLCSVQTSSQEAHDSLLQGHSSSKNGDLRRLGGPTS